MDRHVRHGFLPGGAVRQSRCGTLELVPVPRKMNSVDDALELPTAIRIGVQGVESDREQHGG